MQENKQKQRGQAKDQGACTITHVDDINVGYFYMINKENDSYLNLLELQGTDYGPLKKEPRIGDVFGLFLDEEKCLFRAVRFNNQGILCDLLLLDTGEILHQVDLADFDVVSLPEKFKTLPAQAVYCKLAPTVTNDPHTFLKDSLYSNLYYQIINIESGIMQVILTSDPEKLSYINFEKGILCDLLLLDTGEILHQVDLADFDVVSLPEKFKTLPAQAVYCKLAPTVTNDPHTFLKDSLYSNLYYQIINIESGIMQVILTSDPEKLSYINFEKDQHLAKFNKNLLLPFGTDCNKPKQNFDSEERSCKIITKESLTQSQQRILYEETLTTENAMVAVLGYDVQDDSKICPHYNPKIKACFKGGWCKLQHVSKVQDGWTRDTAVSKTYVNAILDYPGLNQEINMIPTHIIDVEHMYAHILLDKQREPSEHLEELAIKIQDAKKITLTRPPVVNELVLAMYKDTFFYRAKVLEAINDQWFKIFYVDFGNTANVSLENLRDWSTDFDYLPFQAVAVCVANIKPLANNDTKSIQKFKKMVLNRVVKAEIIDNVDDLFVYILDNERFDIGQMLVAQNMALSHIKHFPTDQYGNRINPM